jgi:adenine-specific DNA-methyltransferase
MGLMISNRRYTGSKKALLDDIYNSIAPYYKKGIVFADLFAGTGVVSYFMLKKGMNVIMNDNLRSNYVAYRAWLGSGKFNAKKVKKIIDGFNLINGKKLKSNYFSKIYGKKYFSISDAKKIGYLRDKISKLKLSEREKYILLASLMYATDKVANTVGHFEHYLSEIPVDKNVILKMPEIEKFIGNSTIYNTDANILARKIKCDIAYIDPPYNARQYVNFYHVLENLVRWEKPIEFEGISMKFKRNNLKSDYSRSKAPEIMEDLINNLRAKVIVVSYNNTYSAKSSASNNKISESQLLKILSKKGKVKIKEINHKYFNSGKTNFSGHKEKLYLCTTNL